MLLKNIRFCFSTRTVITISVKITYKNRRGSAFETDRWEITPRHADPHSDWAQKGPFQQERLKSRANDTDYSAMNLPGHEEAAL